MASVKFRTYDFKIETRDGRDHIFDIVRKKFVTLTTEEWVRQHILHFLVEDMSFSKSLIAVEKEIQLNDLRKRFDVVVFNNSGEPKMIVECKSSDEKLDEKVFEQIARYNLKLRVDYLWVTNGTFNYCCRLKNGLELLDHIPDPEEMNG